MQKGFRNISSNIDRQLYNLNMLENPKIKPYLTNYLEELVYIFTIFKFEIFINIHNLIMNIYKNS